MSKIKEINLEQWLKKHKSFFEAEDFQKVAQTLKVYDQETLDKVCAYLKGGLTYLSKKHDYRLYSPKAMLVNAIFGRPPMMEFTMNSKYSVSTHWLWYFLTFIKYITLGGLLVWYIYDIVTVKKKTRQYNCEVFSDLIRLEKGNNADAEEPQQLKSETVPLEVKEEVDIELQTENIIKEKRKHKQLHFPKIPKKYLLAGIGIVIVIVCALEWKSYMYKEKMKKVQEVSANLASGFFEGEYIPVIDDENRIDASFLEFWEEFKKSRSNQIASINIPLKVIFTGWNVEERKVYAEREELWDKNKIEKNWIFMEYYYEGVYGRGNDNFVVLNHDGFEYTQYRYYISVFKKINGKWYLYYYHDLDSLY